MPGSGGYTILPGLNWNKIKQTPPPPLPRRLILLYLAASCKQHASELIAVFLLHPIPTRMWLCGEGSVPDCLWDKMFLGRRGEPKRNAPINHDLLARVFHVQITEAGK